jgi:hypothetical protein
MRRDTHCTQTASPIQDAHLGTLPLGHVGGVGLDLTVAIEAPLDQPHLGCRGVAKGHRRAAVLHLWRSEEVFPIRQLIPVEAWRRPGPRAEVDTGFAGMTGVNSFAG